MKIGKMTNLLWCGALLSGVQTVHAQTLGDVGAASAISSGMNAQSNAGTMAVGARIKQDARALGAAVNQNVDAAMAGDPAAAGAPGGAPGADAGVPGGEAGAAGGQSAPVVRREPLRWGSETGADFLRELLAGSRPATAKSATTRTPKRSSRAQANYSRQVSQMTPAQRKKAALAKYKKPPVGYLSYYLPQDRFKVTSKIWQFVSIEDDRGHYPVKYYYRPWASNFLRILGTRPRNSQPRYNRVIGFHTWQDAMQAGYRPDPVSRPEPGAQLAHLARLTRGPQLARYLEWVYSGQVSPAIFARNFAYIRRVENTVNAQTRTKPYMGETIGLVLGAAVGDNPLPRYIGPGPVAPVATQNAGMAGGADMMGGAPMAGAPAPPESAPMAAPPVP